MHSFTIAIIHLLLAALNAVIVPVPPSNDALSLQRQQVAPRAFCMFRRESRGLSIFSSSRRTHGPRLFSHLDQSNASDTRRSRRRLETDACIQGCQRCERDRVPILGESCTRNGIKCFGVHPGGRGLNRMLCLSAKYNLSMLSFPVWSQFEREPVGQVSKQWE